jgi:hypothetical protein
MGAAGLAVGGLAGAYLEHEHGMFDSITLGSIGLVCCSISSLVLTDL